MTWQDGLSNEVRELEAKANGFDPALADQARNLLRVIRGFEVRARQLTLRASTARGVVRPPLPASGRAPRKPKPLYRTFDQGRGFYLDDPEGKQI